MDEEEFRMKVTWPLERTATKAKFWTKFVAWLTQPTTGVGLIALAVDGAMVATGAVTWRVELPIAAGGFVGLLLPGNPGATGLVAKMLRDLLVAIQTKDAASIMTVAADAEAMLASIGVPVPALPSDAPKM